jgi:arabinose-5-phosphate isomerase
MTIIADIKTVIELEINTLDDLLKSIDTSFEKAVQLILDSQRKIIISGMGKSGLVGRKIAATFSSTGTTAVFLHPSEALHGDLGMVEPGDTLILLGKSGESDEMIGMLPILKKLNCKIISITANKTSTLAKHSDVVLYTPVEKEACALNLAPTCSTTTALVVGDALAIALMKIKNFSRNDFALFHPAGRLGKRLLYRVEDLMKSGEENPVVKLGTPFDGVLSAISEGQVNAVSVIDDQGDLKGLITGYDLRKAMQLYDDLRALKADDIMFDNPTTINKEAYAIEAHEIMKSSHKPLQLLPVLHGTQVVGLITMHDMIRAGL